MGLNTRLVMLFLALTLGLTFVVPVQAQDPTPTPGGDLPYDFEPLPIHGSGYPLIPDFTSVPFVNAVGSYALTLFSLFDSIGWLGILVILLLGARVLWGLYRFIRTTPDQETIDLSGGLSTAAGVTGIDELEQASRVVKRSRRNPFI